MRFSLGCLAGVIAGLVMAGLAVAGYLFMDTRQGLSLFPTPAPADGDVVVTLREEYLNARLKQVAAARGLAWRDPSIALHAPNLVEATASLSLTMLGQSLLVRPHAVMHVTVNQGHISVEVDRVDVSGISVPQEMVDRQMATFKQFAEDQLNAEVRVWLTNTGLHVSSVEIGEGELIAHLSR